MSFDYVNVLKRVVMKKIVLFCLCVILLAACGGGTHVYKTNTKPYTVAGNTYYPLKTVKGFSETGVASWYGKKFHGRKTASGERYNQNKMTAAHKTLPFGTNVRVKNIENGKSVVVRINDRGPFKKGRIIDVSRAAAKKLGMINSGIAKVNIKVVD